MNLKLILIGILCVLVLVGCNQKRIGLPIDNSSNNTKQIIINLAPGEEWYVGNNKDSDFFNYNHFFMDYSNGNITASFNCFTRYPLHDVYKQGQEYDISKDEPLQYPFCIFKNSFLYVTGIPKSETETINNKTEVIIITLKK